MGVENQIEVTYELKNAGNIESFTPPAFTDFKIVDGPSRSSNIEYINGKMSSSELFTYIIQPIKSGNLLVPGAIAIADNRKLKSNNLTVEVIKGNLNSNSNNRAAPTNPFQRQPKKQQKEKPFTQADINSKCFARIDIDKTNVYNGEQIIANYNVYTCMPMQVGLSKPSIPEGFWVQDFNNNGEPIGSENVNINGKMYKKYTIKKRAFFPTTIGDLEIPSAEIDGALQVEMPRQADDFDNFFDEFFSDVNGGMSMQQIPVSLKTNDMKITSKPLPEKNKPASFKGSVGSYTLESNIDKTELSTDETANLIYTIRGTGNIKMISTPQIIFSGDIDAYDPVSKDSITNFDTKVAGYKTFKYVLQPRNAGEINIPPATFTYFDADANEYKTITSPSYTLKVKQGKNAVTQHSENFIPKEIHDIVNTENFEKAATTILPEKPLYWMGYAFPILALVGISFYNRKQFFLKNNSDIIQQKNANAVAQQRLILAYEMLQLNNANGFYNEISKAIWLYISDKLNIPLAKLNKELALKILKEKNIPHLIIANAKSVMQQCESSLYAHTQSKMQMQETFDNSVKTIGDLEKYLS